MFWKNFVVLCNQNNTKPNPVAKELGLSSGSVTKWKNGATPNATTVQRIADYFGVTVEYLIGKTDQKEKPDTDVTPNGLSEDIKKLNEILKTLPPEKLKEIENYALFVQQQQNQ